MADIQTKLGEYLLVAVKNGDETRVVGLLKNEANYVNVEGHFPLLLASFGGHEKIAQLLIDRGATVDTQGPLGMTALTVASERGHHNIVRLLGEHGANVDHARKYSLPPLLLASCKGHTKMVEELLKLNARVILCMEHGEYIHSSLMLASEQGHTEVVRLLLPHFKNVDKFTDHHGLTPLMVASTKGHERVAELLLQKGAQVNLRCQSSYNSLHLAAHCGHHEAASILLKHGALVDLRTMCGESALIIASEHGHTKVVAILLQHNAEVNLCHYSSRRTPLMIACEKHHICIVKLLLQEVKPIDDKLSSGNDDNSQVSKSTSKDNEVTGRDEGANAPSELPQVEAGTMEVCGSQKPTCTIDVNATDFRGHTALCFASKNGDVEIVNMLIKRGANVDPVAENSQSPLLLATRNRCENVVEVLLEMGANPNVFPDTANRYHSYNSVPPLIAATDLECVRIVELLLKHRAKVDVAFGEHMLTPLMLAIYAGHCTLTEMLVKNGANVQYETSNSTSNFTCVDLAKACAHSKIIQLLKPDSENMDTPPAIKKKIQEGNQASIFRKMLDTVKWDREQINPFRREFPVSELFPETSLSVLPQSSLKHSPITTSIQFPPVSYRGEHVADVVIPVNHYSNINLSHTELESVVTEDQPENGPETVESVAAREDKKADLCPVSSVSNPPHVHEAFKILLPVASEWMNIGLFLGIEHYTLKTINADFQRKSLDCLRETIVEWQKTAKPSPTWEALVDAVKPFDMSVAEQIRTKQCTGPQS